VNAYAKRPASYADLVALPERLLGQLVDGELIASPRPALPHAHAATSLGLELGNPFQRGRGGPGGWSFLFEPELHFDQDVLVPDLAGWRRERLPEIPSEPFLTLPPDWLCEVLSPGTEALDRVRKMRIYSRVGVQHVWLVNPLEHLLEVFRLTNGHLMNVAIFEGAQLVRVEPFDQLEWELSVLWTKPLQLPPPPRE
jgi:Uma2 family endonuclease